MRALEERLRINLSTEVRSIRRLDGGVELRLGGDELRRFDGVVVATHADQALRLLEDPSEDGSACSAPSGRPRTTPSSTRTSASCPAAWRLAARGTTSSATAAATTADRR